MLFFLVVAKERTWSHKGAVSGTLCAANISHHAEASKTSKGETREKEEACKPDVLNLQAHKFDADWSLAHHDIHFLKGSSSHHYPNHPSRHMKALSSPCCYTWGTQLNRSMTVTTQHCLTTTDTDEPLWAPKNYHETAKTPQAPLRSHCLLRLHALQNSICCIKVLKVGSIKYFF